MKARLGYVVVNGRVYVDCIDVMNLLKLSGHEEPHKGLSEWLEQVEGKERL